MRAELLLQYLQQLALGQVHLEDGMQNVIPLITVTAHAHGQRDEIVCSHAIVIAHRTPEISNRVQSGDFAAENVDS